MTNKGMHYQFYILKHSYFLIIDLEFLLHTLLLLHHKILTHENNIASLRICEHISSYIVSICILQATRKR